MPKRKNPFGEYTPLQLKTHVGFRQAASEEEKQEMYARTKALLFQGANPQAKLLPSENGHINGILAGVQNGTTSKSNGLLKYFSNGSGSVTAKPKEQSSNTVAGLCVGCRGSGGIQGTCSYCDKRICAECIQPCCVCSQGCCPFCSVLNYNEAQVRSFCLNCLSET